MIEAKMSLIRELVEVDDASTTPIYEQIYEDIRKSIIEGKLAPGTRLPSTRSLTDVLGVSRTTVRLRVEGRRVPGASFPSIIDFIISS